MTAFTPDQVTVVIPSIPPRVPKYLPRAIASLGRQVRQPDAISVAIDLERGGAGPTRTRAMRAVRTEWTAFLDDDDELYPRHLQALFELQADTTADVLWPWFDVRSGGDPFPQHRGRQWSSDDPHSFPIAVMVRTELALCTSGFGAHHGEDFTFFLELDKLGARFAHTEERTWAWDHGSGNTSGRPDRW